MSASPAAGYDWAGSEKTGSGKMTNEGVTGTQMDYALAFLKPHEGKAAGAFKVTDTAGMSRVKPGASVCTMGFPWNAMNAFMNMDKMMGGDFESGLGNMKKYVESHPTAGAVDIKEVDFPTRYYAGVRKTIPMADIMKFCGETYGMVSQAAGSNINGPAVGIYYTWDTVGKTTDMFAGFPVVDTTKPVAGCTFVTVAATKAYMAAKKGGYSDFGKYHMALMKYAADKGKAAMPLEEYAVSPKTEPDSNKWVTNIYYLEQ